MLKPIFFVNKIGFIIKFIYFLITDYKSLIFFEEVVIKRMGPCSSSTKKEKAPKKENNQKDNDVLLKYTIP